MKIKLLFFLLFFLLTVFTFAQQAEQTEQAQKLEYNYIVGSKYKIVSEVDENVFLDGIYSHNAKMLNKISVEVAESDAESGSGLMRATLELSEKITGIYSTYEVTEKYESTYRQDKFGATTVDKQYFIPMARNIPAFPDYPLNPGDKWSIKGEEVHDFRKGFNIAEPYAFPVAVDYQYLGKDETGLYDVIKIEYKVDHETDLPVKKENYFHISRISGSTRQIMKWDNEKGHAYSYNEEFIFEFELLSGDSMTFTGTAKGEVIEAEGFDKDQIAEEVEEALKDIEDVHVEKTDEGIKITMEDIQFLPDSAILAKEEDKKLAKIIEILKNNPNRELLIIGHTALAGSAEGRKTISTQRAKAIAEYILAAGARTEKQIMIQGKGADEPVATNATAEGRKKNRRVEIIILEN